MVFCYASVSVFVKLQREQPTCKIEIKILNSRTQLFKVLFSVRRLPAEDDVYKCLVYTSYMIYSKHPGVLLTSYIFRFLYPY